jgi:hypothetical protein
LRHVLAPDQPSLDGVHEIAVVACLLPVVAERAHPLELVRRDLLLAGPVRAHQAHMLPPADRATREDDLAPGRHRDDDVRHERLVAWDNTCTDTGRGRRRPSRVDVIDRDIASAGDERLGGRLAVHAGADDRRARRVRAAERLGGEHRGGARA